MIRRGTMATTAVGLMLAATAGHAQTAADAAREAFRDDVHAAAGLQCLSCHQDGRPDEVPIARTAVGPLCAKCHSDAAYIRRFDPQLRVDQYAQYLTSTHGKRMAAGELRSATCADCHGSHGVRSVSDVRHVPRGSGADGRVQSRLIDRQQLVAECTRSRVAHTR